MKGEIVPRKGWLCSGLILGWLCFPGGGWCEPLPSPKPENILSQPAVPQAVSQPKATPQVETEWLPLREVIQKYSETTGNQIRISGTLQTNDKLMDQVYSANDPSWLEDFNRIEIFNEQTGKKEIIILGKVNGSSPTGPSLNTRTTRNHSRKNISRAREGAKKKLKSKPLSFIHQARQK